MPTIGNEYHRRAYAASSRLPHKNTPKPTVSYLSSSSKSSDNLEPSTTQTHRKYLATCIPGLATVLAQELEQLGADQVTPSGTAAVQFQATLATALRILLWVRTAHKILEFLAASDEEEPISTPDDLYQFIQSNVNVKELLGDGKGGLLTLAVSVQFNNPRYIPDELNHSHFSALTIKNALVDRVRDLRGDGTRPDVDIENPQLPLVAVLRGIPTSTPMDTTPFRSNAMSRGSNQRAAPASTTTAAAHVSLYRCLHPPISLHKRGYRSDQAIHKAALKESLAAGLLLCAGWDKICQTVASTSTTTSSDEISNDNSPSCYYLVDPMAGSGSLVIEAAMIAADLAPGLVRIKSQVQGFINPPVLQWKYPMSDTDNVPLKEVWKDLLRDATLRAQQGIHRLQQPQEDGLTSPYVQIHANDIHSGALDLLQQSLRQAGLEDVVQVHSGDCQTLNIHKGDDNYSNDNEVPSVGRSSTLVVTNPPWGIRLEEDHIQSWDSLRVFLRDVCLPDHTEAWILSGNKDATRHLALKKSKSVSLQTGDHDLRWIQYYIGSRVTASTPIAIESKREIESNASRRTNRQTQEFVSKAFKPRVTKAFKPRAAKKPKSNQAELPVDTWFID